MSTLGAMNVCIACGVQLDGDAVLCSHHLTGFDEGWAVTNRIMCDLLHRGIVPARAPVGHRDPLRDDADERAVAPVEAVAG